jgi:hypothetical protein
LPALIGYVHTPPEGWHILEIFGEKATKGGKMFRRPDEKLQNLHSLTNIIKTGRIKWARNLEGIGDVNICTILIANMKGQLQVDGR